jgi:hypothetical protein
VFCESSRRFTDLLKLPRLHFSPLPFASRSLFNRNEVDLGQFETVLVLQHDASHSSPSLTLDDYEPLIGPEPYLEGVFCPVWMRTDFFETELSKECERSPNGLGEFLLRRGLHHLPSPFRQRGQPRGSSSHSRTPQEIIPIDWNINDEIMPGSQATPILQRSPLTF